MLSTHAVGPCPSGSAQWVAEQLLAVEQEAEAVAAALAAQQQDEPEEDWVRGRRH